MKLLVTGGAGFIGSNFVHVVANERPDWPVRVYDLLTYAGNRTNLIDDATHEFVQGDVANRAAVDMALADCDLIVHFAAESHVTRSEADPERFYRTNVTGTEVVLAAAKTANVPVIHISTDEVYGPITDGYFTESDKAIGEQQATSPYAKSKSLADDVATAAMAHQSVIVVRPTNNYGPRQHPEKALPRWITNVIDGVPIPLWAPGTQVRDWLYVEDTSRAILHLIEHGLWGQVYNVGANHDPEITNLAAAQAVCRALAADPAQLIDLIPDPRPDHDVRYGVDTTKITALGYRPDTQFAAGLKQTVDWYRANAAWWRPLKAEAESIYEKKEAA